MAAVIQHSELHMPFPEAVARWFAAEPSSVPVEQPAQRPPLRVIPGGREAALRRRQAPQVYRRRRLVVALAVTALSFPSLLLAGRWAVATAIPARHDAPAVTVTPAATVTGGDMTASYVVQPGDTLWSIATTLRPGVDPRPLVDELARRVGPGSLEAGRRIDLTGLVRG
jgi:hypothetical protein